MAGGMEELRVKQGQLFLGEITIGSKFLQLLSS